MRIWIDLANSPHPLLFAPVAARLEELGHTVLLTARDHGQTVELARSRWPEVEVIGGRSPGGRAAKARQIARRVRALRDWAKGHRVDLALSHNSYAQLAAARSLGRPAVTAMDYEHQPANHLGFRLAETVLLPEAFPDAAARRQGAGRKQRRYDGFKEEIYLGDFDPDEGVFADLGLERSEGVAMVVARTPPSGALYHQFDNPLFVDALSAVDAQGALSVVLPRRDEQRRLIESLGLAHAVVPKAAADSRSLMFHADLVLGAGGTMTREAALMGVPTLSLFAGTPPAVDRHLEQRGLLDRLRRVEQVREIQPGSGTTRPIEEIRARGVRVMEEFVQGALAGRTTDGG